MATLPAERSEICRRSRSHETIWPPALEYKPFAPPELGSTTLATPVAMLYRTMSLGFVATCPLGCISSKYTPPARSYSAPSVNTYPVASFVGVVPGGRIWADAEPAPNARNVKRPAPQRQSATRRMSVSPHVPPAAQV